MKMLNRGKIIKTKSCFGRYMCLLILALVLAGCSRQPDINDLLNINIAPNPQQETSLSVETVTMQVIPLGWVNMSQMTLHRRESLLNEVLTARGIPAQLRLTGGYGPSDNDIKWIQSRDYRRRAAEGEFADIAAGIDNRPGLAALSPAPLRNAMSVSGAEYGIALTWAIDKRLAALSSGLRVRTDVLEAINLPLPTTADELINASIVARDLGLDYEIVIEYNEALRFLHRTYEEWPFLVCDHSLIMYRDGDIKAYIGSDIFFRDAQILQRMYQHEILRVYMTLDDRYFSLARNWNVLAAVLPYPEEFAGYYTILQFEPHRANLYSDFIFDSVLAINRNSANKELALDILELFYSDQEVFDLFVYGEVGRDYDIPGDGYISHISENRFWAAFQHSILARSDINEVRPPDFYFVDENTLMSVPHFNSQNEALRQRLLESDTYRNIMMWRVNGDPSININAEIAQLNLEGLSEFVYESREDYRMLLD